MGCGFGTTVFSMFIVLISLALIIVAAITNYWFLVESKEINTEEFSKANTYHFGFWFKCYDDGPPASIPQDDLTGTDNDCVQIYKDLVRRSSDNITSDEQLIIHLSRSYIGLSIVAGAAQLAVLFTLICGTWPGDCKKPKKQGLYFTAAVILLISVMAGCGSGICFLAAREVEADDMTKYSRLDTSYGWSFMLHWIGTGLAFVGCFIIMYLVKHANSDRKSAKDYYFNHY